MENLVVLIGNVGQDPESNLMGNQKKVVRFSLATSERYKDKDGNKAEKTQWHKVVFFGAQAEVIEKYVSKGDRLHVKGKVEYRSYEDKEGQTRYVTEIIGSAFNFLSGKPSGVKAGQSQTEEDDLPY